MIPARIGQSAKKLHELPDGEYFGTWQGYFCWLKHLDGTVFYRFDTKTKMKGVVRVRVIFKCPHAYIYEILPNQK